jgi:hypothetical protein
MIKRASETPAAVSRWRNEFAKAMDGLRDDTKPERWSDVFVPTGHYKALHPETMLVEGMRGAGKSFWTTVLSSPELRKNLASSNTELWLKAALESITDCRAISFDGHSGGGAPEQPRFIKPDASAVTQWLAQPGFDAKIFWELMVLTQFSIDPELGLPVPDKFEPWAQRMAWAQQNPERVHRALALVDQSLTAKREVVLIVIDGLDRVSNRFSDTQALMRGLFQLLLDFRFARGLRFKVFVREDILSHAASAVSDASKLMSEKVTLDWSQQDLFGLAFHYIAQGSDAFKRRYESVTGFSWKNYERNLDNEKLLDSALQEKFWIWLAGPHMGKASNKGHSYPWIGKHLSDGKGRTSPRTFLWAIKEALTDSIKRASNTYLILHPESIRDGVRQASLNRVNELDNEYVWVRSAMESIKGAGLKVPMDWSELNKAWQSNKYAVIAAIDSLNQSTKNTMLPWEDIATNNEKIIALRDTLERIGIIQIKQRAGLDRIDLPDIYRLAYKIPRTGGVAVIKKNRTI